MPPPPDPNASPATAATPSPPQRTPRTALAAVRPAAENVLHTFTGLGLDTCQIEFGISLDAEAGAIIAKTSATAHFTVTLAGPTNRQHLTKQTNQ